jgi:putative transposase
MLRSRRDLIFENLALRQQLAAFMTKERKPTIRSFDRAFWVILRQLWSRWATALVIVKPETVIRWHREGFRLFWRRRSRAGRPRGRPAVEPKIRELVRRMRDENGWGAKRIHGELLMLGIDVSERKVSRCLRHLPSRRARGQQWKTFLRNHREVIAAMDFFTVFTATFRLLHVLVVIRHGRREIVHFNVTGAPSPAWVVQQIREAFPFDPGPKYFVFDRDKLFPQQVIDAVAAIGATPKRIGFRAPWQNGVVERWIGTCRRELLDHVIVFNEAHLRRLLREYLDYYHDDRTHCGLEKQTPKHRATERVPLSRATVSAQPRLGGLHHRYEWRRAA